MSHQLFTPTNFSHLLRVVQKIGNKEIESDAGMYEFMCQCVLDTVMGKNRLTEKELRSLELEGIIEGLQNKMRPLLDEWTKLQKEIEEQKNATSTK
ncbi:MAG: hypothetical protein H7836_04280 [Magnetococcus sp. YQC-3]